MIIACKIGLTTVLMLSFASGISIAEPHPQPLSLSRRGEFESNHTKAEQLSQQALEKYQANQLSQAIKLWEQALILVREVGDKPQEATFLGNLAIAYKTLGNYVKAIETNQKSLEIIRELGNLENESKVLKNLGNVYEALGDYDNAIASYERSLTIACKINNQSVIALALNNLGQIYSNQGKYDKAINTLEDSLSISRAIKDIPIQNSALINLGSTYHSQGDLQEATAKYQESLQLAQSSGNKQRELEALGSLGLVHEDLKKYPQAIDYLQKSLTIAKEIGDPEAQGMGLNNLGHVFLAAGKLEEAEKALREAVKLLDEMRPGLSDAYKISIFDTKYYTYNLLQQILVAANKPEAALEAAEQGRARAFVDLLATRTAKKPDIKSINSQLPFNLKTNISIERIRAIAKAQKATLVEYTIVPADDFKHRGKLRTLAEEILIWVVKPTGEVELRRRKIERKLSLKELIDNGRTCVIKNECRGNTKKLTFSVGDMVKLKQFPQETWEVVNVDYNNDKIDVIQPSWRKEEDWQSGDEKDLAISHSINDVEAIVNSSEAKKQSLHQLHQLLIEPIADILPKDPEDRVIFVPQEELFLVPFAALQDSKGKYLIKNHTIVIAPSIQVLNFTNQLKNSVIKDDFKSALVVGNPTMPTIPGEEKPLGALSNAKIEADTIAKFLKTTSLTGSKATKTDVVQKMPKASLIHLATHGLLDEIKQFGLSQTTKQLSTPGALALAPSQKDKNDGFLTSEEIMDMKLKAQMVVLSACNTGRGNITGDGIIGLSRSFIAAGVPSVVVSLWAVPDAPTSELMQEFYSQLRGNHNDDKAKALRQAMLKIMEKPQYRDPKNWAAFTLIGEAD